MKNKMSYLFRKGSAVALSAALVIGGLSLPSPVIRADEGEEEIIVNTGAFTVDKISNPDRGSGEIDGLVEGGDRYNSYAWCMAARGDKLYIGTVRGLSELVMGQITARLQVMGIEKEQAYALIDTITNSNFGHDPIDKGGDIISYDTTTGEMKVLTTGNIGTSFRMAINYNDDIYIGSYSGETNNIYRIDKDENIEKVYETSSGTSMRAACEYEGDLYFGGVDSTQELTDEYKQAAKLAILKMDKDNPSQWDRVADFSDFDPIYAKDPAVKSEIASPIWDIVSFDGYIYATIPYSHGFIMYKGHPAVGEETQNAYGWHWEEVIGLNNGINNVALAEDVEGYTGKATGNLSMTATPFVFQDKLYLMDFDNTLESMTSTLTNLFIPSGIEKGELLSTMYMTLSHPQSLWVMDNETGAFEKVENFSNLMEGTCNEYLWRTAEYDGELYITTMDSSVIYRYLTQYTDFGFDPENLQDKATNIVNIANLIKVFGLDESDDENIQKIANLIIALADLIQGATDEEDPEALDMEEVEQINDKYEQLSSQLTNNANNFLKSFKDKEVVDEVAQDIAEGKDNDTVKLIAALGESDLDKVIGKMAGQAVEQIDDESGAGLDDEIEDGDEPDNRLQDIISYISQLIEDNVDNINQIVEESVEKINEVDWQTVYMYSYISLLVNNEVQGFDMFKTSDGVNFTVVTNDGFGDRYNYGGRTLQTIGDELYVGTSNPFYGAQLFKFTNNSIEAAEKAVADAVSAADEAIKAADEASANEYASETDKDAITNAKGAVETAKAAADVAETSKDRNEAAKALQEAVDELAEAVQTANDNSAQAKEAADEAAKTAAAQLAAAKTAAEERLDDYADAKKLADFTADEQTAFNQAVTDGKAAIEALTDKDEAAQALTNAKAAVDAALAIINSDRAAAAEVAKAAEQLAVAKTAAEERLEDYSDAKAKSDATADEKAAYDKVVADGKTAINAATDKDAVTTALKGAKAAVDSAIVKIEKDRTAANKVTDTINKLPKNDKVATTDKAAIEAARKAYDALTVDQKKNISANTLKKLETAETTLAAVEAKDKADKELAAAKKAAQKAMNSEVKITFKGEKIVVKWSKTTSADGYDVYVKYCGKKNKDSVITINNNGTTKATIKKINGKKLNLKKQYRVYVVAYKMIDGKKVTLAKSNVGHFVSSKNKKYTNVKSIKLDKKTYTVNVGKTTKVKAKISLVDKKKKHIPKSHGAKFRYRTSDSSIATVSKSGQIKGIKKGTCTIYVYAINGKMKKAKVTVK